MIPIDKLLDVKSIFTHETCPDGTASAMICAKAFHRIGLTPKVYTIQYKTRFMDNLEPRPGQLFVDITPPEARWEEWKTVDPIVLDHHIGVKYVTEGLGGVFGGSDSSGATLAYENVMLPLSKCEQKYDEDMTPWLELSSLGMIRDTWKKDDPDWVRACGMANALLFFGSRDLVEQARSDKSINFAELQKIGDTVYGSTMRRAGKLARGALFAGVSNDDGQSFKIGLFNCTDKTISDAANFLIDHGCDVAASFFMNHEDDQTQCVVSLRSNGRIDVQKIATSMGGGGHTKAAGFRMPGSAYSISMKDIMELILRKVAWLPDKPPCLSPIEMFNCLERGKEDAKAFFELMKKPL